jgi:hypothetical protein
MSKQLTKTIDDSDVIADISLADNFIEDNDAVELSDSHWAELNSDDLDSGLDYQEFSFIDRREIRKQIKKFKTKF